MWVCVTRDEGCVKEISFPAPTTRPSIVGWLAARWHNLDWTIRLSLIIWAIHRTALTLLGALLALLAPSRPRLGDYLFHGQYLRYNPLSFFLLSPWQRWDTNWYVSIAQNGYNLGDGSTNFPPLFPLLTAILGRLLLGHYLLAGIIIANLAYIGALIFLCKLCDHLFNRRVAWRAMLFLAAFPTAYFLATAYTESLFLLTTIAAFYYAERNMWARAALLSALAYVTRLQSLALIVPLTYIFMTQRGFVWRKTDWRLLWANVRRDMRQALGILIAPLSFVAYMGYVYLVVGDFNFGNHLKIIWNVDFAMPWFSLLHGIGNMFNPDYVTLLYYNIWDLGMLVMSTVLLVVWLQHRLPLSYALYWGLTLLVLLTRQDNEGLSWMSMARYLITIFPTCMMLALLSMKMKKPRRVLIIFGALQLAWAAQFIMWMWAG